MAAVRILVKMQSSESDHFYTTEKNPRNTPDKLEFYKYDPILRKKVLYKEKKIK